MNCIRQSILLSLVFSALLLSAGCASGQPKTAPPPEEGAVASYKDDTWYQSDVDNYLASWSLYAGPDETPPTDREVVDSFIQTRILREEAERRGFGATEEEIEDFVQGTAEMLEQEPQARENIEQYCAQKNITLDAYLDEIRQIAPSTLARGKMDQAFLESYCQAHDIPFLQNQACPPEARQALDAEKDKIIRAHMGDVTYYISE